MTTRPIRALLGAVTLAAAVITAGHPAGATGKAPPCGPTPTIIVSNADTITGTECADWIYPGVDTGQVDARGGNDRVIVEGPPSTTTHGCCGPPQIRVDLGAGDDLLHMARANRVVGRGGPGDDDLRADWMVTDGTLTGEGGADRLWTSSDEVDLGGGDDDDRLTVTAKTSWPDERYWPQVLAGGPGDDLMSSIGASGTRLRAFAEGPGDDTYLMHQGTEGTSRERIEPGYPAGDGYDVAVMDHDDSIAPILFDAIEKVTFGGTP